MRGGEKRENLEPYHEKKNEERKRKTTPPHRKNKRTRKKSRVREEKKKLTKKANPNKSKMWEKKRRKGDSNAQGCGDRLLEAETATCHTAKEPAPITWAGGEGVSLASRKRRKKE